MSTDEHIPVQDNQTVATLLEADERKSDGNNYFRQSKWEEAIVAYQAALNVLPKRRHSLPTSISDDDQDQDEFGSSSTPNVEPQEELNGVQLTEGVLQLRSVLFANIGACHVKLGEHKEAVEACTQALKDNPTYEKALQRRAASNELLGTWSSLTAAQEDYNNLLPIVSASQKLDVESKLRALKPRLDAAQKKETSEMLGKLKGFGDSLLGNFGLSTDNFKFEPNGQGGYSMNFVK